MSFNKFKSLIILFQIFGLAPFSDHRFTYYCLLINSYLQIIIPSIVFLAFIYLRDETESVLAITIIYMQILSIIITHQVHVTNAFWMRDKQYKLLNALAKTDKLFQRKLKDFNCYGHEALIIWLKLFGLIVFIVLCKGYNLIVMAYKTDVPVKIQYPSYYSELILLLTQVQCLFYVLLLNNRLNLFRMFLFKISDDRHFSSDNSFIVIEPKLSVTLTLSSTESFDELLKYERLLYFKRIYGKLFDINQLINETFGLPLIVMFVKYFFNLTIHAYWLFQSLAGPFVEYNLAKSNISSMLSVSLPMIIFVRACFLCTQSVNE